MKINKILPTPSLNKIWSELTKITNKLTTLEELVMNNATSSEIFENARQRIVNSALGKALGLTADTSVLDAAIAVEGVADNGALNKTFTPTKTAQTYTIPKGYTSGGTVKCNAVNLSLTNMTIGYSSYFTDQNISFTANVGDFYIAAMAGDPGNYQNFAIKSGATLVSNLTQGDTPPSGSRFARIILIKATANKVEINWGAYTAGTIIAKLNI